jgi:hypothetical protein
MECEISKERFEDLVQTWKIVSEFTSKVQRDISIAIVSDENNKEKLKQQLKLSEEKMQEIMDNAVLTFLSAMPLATMNHSNLFNQALALHSNLTKNPVMHMVVDELRKREEEENA